MIMRMNNSNHNTIRERSQGRLKWIIVLGFWLASVSVSVLHAQKHTIVEDLQCQQCLSNFENSPFIPSDEVLEVPLGIVSLLVENHVLSQLSHQPIKVCNRGPPKLNS